MRRNDNYNQKQLGPDKKVMWSKVNSLFEEDETKNWPKGQLKKGAAEKLISKSAYWYDHSSGCPVRTPGHYKHIYLSSFQEWKIDFGANTFLISEAAFVCADEIKTYLTDHSIGSDDLLFSLRNRIPNCVENYEGQYLNYSNAVTNDGFLKFGSNGIKIDAFIRVLFDHVGLKCPSLGS